MKTLCLLLISLPAFGQLPATIQTQWLDSEGNKVAATDPRARFKVVSQFSSEDGVKTLSYTIRYCRPPQIFLAVATLGLVTQLCVVVPGNADVDPFVQSLVTQLFNWARGNPWQIIYGILARPIRSSLTTVQPLAPPDPSLVLLDGLSGNLLKFDLTTGTVVSQLTPPTSAIGPLGIRPSADGPSNEVWVANGAYQLAVNQVTVADLSGQTVLANIPLPSIPTSATPAGIVFTNSGATAFEVFRYASPDASGNQGALVVFNAAQRVVNSTLLLQYPPAAIVMAPDGLTVYLLSTGGEITYYDVLSGTADLSASTYPPGMNSGYPGGNVFIHPDGTRLFWNVGIYLTVFDLTTRTVTTQFNSGLPTTSTVALEVSQDGSTATMSNGAGTVVLLDTRYGIVQGTIQNPGATLAFPGN